MVDLSYDAFKQGKLKVDKPKNDLSYSAFLQEKAKSEEIITQRQELRAQGLPVGRTKKKAEPTILGSMVRGIVKPVADVATNIVNVGQIAAGVPETQPFSGDYLGKVEGLGKVDLTKSPLAPENIKTIKKSVGTGLELGSYLTFGGAGKKAIQAGTSKLTETAAKETFKEYFRSQFPKLLVEGALTGAAYTAGSQMREGVETGKPFSYKQALDDIAISTVLTPAVALGLRKLFGTSADKIIKAREVEHEIKKAEILGKPIPPVATKFDNVPTPTTNLLKEEFTPTTSDLTPEIKTREGAFVETPKAEPTTPLEIRASKAAGKEEFIANEIKFLERTKQKVPAKLQEQASKAWDRMHPIADTSKIKLTPETPIPAKPSPIKPLESTPGAPAKDVIPPAEEIPPGSKQYSREEYEHAYDFATQNLDEKEWSPTTLKEQLERFKELEATDPDKLLQLATDSKASDTLRNNWALSFLENKAQREGNIELSKQLSYSDVGTKAGGELVGGRFKDKDTLASTMREVRKAKAEAQGISTQKGKGLDKEEQQLLSKLKQQIEQLKGAKLTSDEVKNIISEITCK